ncbi:PAS domain S-box protein [Halobium salinum]|uniref:histidine kinase n=1 Tax=Halobium salinum TaxID=1364940 RepID=A0ABD5PF44_9EURY|nr:PAS domain S-box protein [Halobium salinum]
MEPTIRVLVVDDDPQLAELTGLCLERHGDDVEAVVETTAADGFDRLDGVDCVVSDYDMPETNGLDFLAAVRERDPDLPFVLFTAKGSEEIASRAISAGVTDYLRKGSGGERYEMLANRVRNAVERHRAETELERTETRYRRLVEQELFGIYIVQDGRIEYANPGLAEILGHDQEALVGMEFARFIDDEDLSLVREQVRRRVEGEVDDIQYTFTITRYDGREVDVEVHGGVVDYGGEPAVMGALVEVSDRERRSRAIGALNRASRELMRAGSRESVASVAVSAVEDILHFEAAGVHLDHGAGALAPVATSETVSAEFDGDPETYREDCGDRRHRLVWNVFRSQERRTVGDDGPNDRRRGGVVAPLGDHGVLLAFGERSAEPDEATVELVDLLAANVEAALDRTAHEERLNELHAATRRLMTAPTREDVAEAAVDTARDVLGYEMNGVHLVDESGERLPPAAVSERSMTLLESAPTLSVDDSVAGEAFRRGEVRAYGDVREASQVANTETVIRRELVVPLGDQGVFIAGGTEPGSFEEAEVSLAKVFAANVEAALTRASREAAVRERETELRRQNERLEEFAGVVSHDLRNPLEVARGYTELARESADTEELAAVSRAHDRLATRVDELLALAREGAPVEAVETVDVGEVSREAWRRIGDTAGRCGEGDPDEPTLTVAEATPTVDADPERLRLLLENLLSNAVEHGGESVAVRVGPLGGESRGADESGSAETGFAVADDGPGVPAEEREAVFDYGHTTTQERGGNGFGLAVVRTVADAHGWDVRLVGSESGGARFEVVV